MSVRRIPKQRRSVSGLFWSLKNGSCHIPYESGLELDLCTVLELDPTVTAFESQPVVVEYRRPNGRLCRGFPDFLVTYAGGRRTELIDVKYREELRAKWDHLRPRLRAASMYARGRGWLFRLRTEREIRTPFLGNARYLMRFLRDGADLGHAARLTDSLAALRDATIGQLLNVAYVDSGDRAIAVPTLWNMIATRAIIADLHSPLTLASRISLGGIQ